MFRVGKEMFLKCLRFGHSSERKKVVPYSGHDPFQSHDQHSCGQCNKSCGQEMIDWNLELVGILVGRDQIQNLSLLDFLHSIKNKRT